MMSSNLLQRASHAFRMGYRDGYFSRANVPNANEGTFAHRDYCEGYMAGVNDNRLDKK